MKMNLKFNRLSLSEYTHYINNHKKYTDFNTLGLYRSIIENNNLSVDDKIIVRELAHSVFKKSFDFLQIKDPGTYIAVSTLGLYLTKADEERLWDDLRKNQQLILKDKRIRHRNFGNYSKHNCGYDNCRYNGLMIKQGFPWAETCMYFNSDKNSYQQKIKAERRKADRKNSRSIINRQFE